MRLLPLLTLLPALALAEPPYQKVFDAVKGKLDNAVEGLKNAIPENIPDIMDAGASKVAAEKVQRINIRNFQRKLAPKLDSEEEWMIYFTGGNKTCFGRCTSVDVKWNESVPLLAALPAKPDAARLRLGKVDCEKDTVLCTALSTGLPAIWHFDIPRKTDPQAKTPIHIVPLNMTTITVPEIVAIPHSSKARYLESPEYTGSSHPMDGWLAQYGLLMPLGYLLWGLGSVPSWMMMIVVSFVSRQIMSKRMGAQPGPGAYGAPAERARAPSGPMPPPAPRGGSSQGKMVGGGKKKNK